MGGQLGGAEELAISLGKVLAHGRVAPPEGFLAEEGWQLAGGMSLVRYGSHTAADHLADRLQEVGRKCGLDHEVTVAVPRGNTIEVSDGSIL